MRIISSNIRKSNNNDSTEIHVNGTKFLFLRYNMVATKFFRSFHRTFTHRSTIFAFVYRPREFNHASLRSRGLRSCLRAEKLEIAQRVCAEGQSRPLGFPMLTTIDSICLPRCPMYLTLC